MNLFLTYWFTLAISVCYGSIVFNSGNQIICNQLKCPAETTRCISSDQTSQDFKTVIHHSECRDINGERDLYFNLK